MKYLLFLSLFLIPFVPAFGADWYDTDYNYSKAITIDSSDFDETVKNYPILLNLTDTDLTANAQADCDDILFTNAGNTSQFDHEIEDCDLTANDIAVIWVEIPQVNSTADDVFYMYYGNSTVSSQEDITGTWNANFSGVYHLHDDFLDSTSNSVDGTNSGSTDADCNIADCQDFDGNDYIDFTGDQHDDSADVYTLSGWASLDSSSSNRVMVGKWHSGQQYVIYTYPTANKWSFAVDDGGPNRFATSSSTYVDSTQHYIVGRANSTHVLLNIDWNLEQIEGDAYTVITNTSEEPRIGCYSKQTSNCHPGLIDEVRFIDAVMPDEWIKADYECQRSDGDCISVGAQGEKPSGDNCVTTCTQAVSDGSIYGDSITLNIFFNQTDGAIFADSVDVALTGGALSQAVNDGTIFGDSVNVFLDCNITCTISAMDGIILGDTATTSGVEDAIWNTIVLHLNSPESDRLGGVFSMICPANHTLTGLFSNGTFACTDMADFFP